MPLPRRWLADTLGSADFARVFTVTVIATIAATHLIERLAGTPTLVTIIAAECLIAVATLVVRRGELSALRLLPMTLLVFLAWSLASVVWSVDPGASFIRWLSTAAVALLAVTIGHIRDTLQTVRAVGDVARWLLAISLGLEILSGILLDTPFTFLGISGDLAEWGPIQGVFGTRNMLGFFSVIALVTFAIELRTRSVRTGVAAASIALAAATALLSASPTVFVLVIVVASIAGVLYLVRRLPEGRRTPVQWALAGVAAIGGVAAYLQRSEIIRVLGAADDLAMRTELWRLMEFYVRRYPVQGWGWFGPWDPQESPFAIINYLLEERHTTALNAYMDALLQLGWAGVAVFVAFFALTFARSWLDASRRRAAVHAWIPLLVAALAVVSVFESFTLFGIGWLLLVVCAVRAGQSRSWRERLGSRTGAPDLPRSPGDHSLDG
ncbi:O-antigen ligase family protein [Microbacterium dauci]|uniref:O-antigen ligase family protein n=1 Tax=Microbacterium dauci TaxID=3048008 RepID=A0ABT6Z9W2_9MICO|nr:O-antigen ligase family protein [Microbacterium sp. LX3-4]MDJ1112947.1 O-antigen ligase family protein [Microbacterium sp. LX3-4]